jgi:hypothetical protein
LHHFRGTKFAQQHYGVKGAAALEENDRVFCIAHLKEFMGKQTD